MNPLPSHPWNLRRRCQGSETWHKSPAERGPFARLLDGWEPGAITVGLVLAARVTRGYRAPRRPESFQSRWSTRARRRPVATAMRHWRTARARRFAVRDARCGRWAAAPGSGACGRRGRCGVSESLDRRTVQVALAAGQSRRCSGCAPFKRGCSCARACVFVARRAGARAARPGGDFVKRARRNGWAGPDSCLASDDELTALFVRRWADLTRLREEPHFKSPLGELRRYYRFLLLHPERGPGSDAPARERAGIRLRYVEALSRRDTEYPAGLARGSLLGELGGCKRVPGPERAPGPAGRRRMESARTQLLALCGQRTACRSDGAAPVDGP